ncbi:hypothetical protein C5S35_16655 [Candidatus Methanophagaceae archaeon]|nr:hypothetical protein C5S35_16655 [Methanophagales archaeon]
MNSNRIALMAVAVVAIGIFALPSTVSLFSGQHSWYDLSEFVGGVSGVNNVPCEKCHADIADEMISGDNGVHGDLTCAMCHRTPFTNYTYARGHYEHGTLGTQPPRPGEEAHAASVVECMDCHDGAGDKGTGHESNREYVGKCGDCHQGGYSADFIAAGGFNRTPQSDDTGTKAAHKQFVLDSINETLMEGANEACIACHTRVGVNITWTKNEYLEFTAEEDAAGNWTIASFTAGGENVTYVNSSNTWTNP